MKYCPCESQKRYLDCCGAYLQKMRIPETPEALMRSRYTAFVEKNAEYIRKTMKPPALLKFNKKEFLKRNEQWLGLKVLQAYMHPENLQIGFVEFIASYKDAGNFACIHELSEFHFEQGKWYYVDGKHIKD
jgi:SEC-C motif-containing protein